MKYVHVRFGLALILCWCLTGGVCFGEGVEGGSGLVPEGVVVLEAAGYWINVDPGTGEVWNVAERVEGGLRVHNDRRGVCVSRFVRGGAVVVRSEGEGVLYGVVGRDGQMVVEVEHRSLSGIGDGVYVVGEGEGRVLLGPGGRAIQTSEPVDRYGWAGDGLISFRYQGGEEHWGFIDYGGKKVGLPISLDSESTEFPRFQDQRCVARQVGGQTLIFNLDFRLVEFVSKVTTVGRYSDGLARVGVQARWLHIHDDILPKAALEGEELPMSLFYSMHELYGYLDQEGWVAVMPQFYSAGDFSEGLAPVSNGRRGRFEPDGRYVEYEEEDSVRGRDRSVDWKWGFINKQGRVVVPMVFDRVGNFRGGRAKVFVGGGWTYIDRGGRVIFGPRYEQATDYQDGYAGVSVDGKVCVIDAAGEVVVQTGLAWGAGG